MTRCPAYISRFPYTTLFRSVHVSGPIARHSGQGGWFAFDGAAGRMRPFDHVSNGFDLVLRSPIVAREHHQVEDRKSTRLNSSHPSISYAVFCLKKKKKRSAV